MLPDLRQFRRSGRNRVPDPKCCSTNRRFVRAVRGCRGRVHCNIQVAPLIARSITGLSSMKLEFISFNPFQGSWSMTGKRYSMNAGRTTKQGQQINVGKESPEYLALVSTLIMNADDMKEEGIVSGGSVRVLSDNGEGVFFCKEGKVPAGMIFVPYGPPTCKLMGQTTDGTGMPTSKGWEVEVEPISTTPAAGS